MARTREMSVLEEAYGSGSLEMVVVYGRRRVGKTRLLREFCRGKGSVHFFTARETTAAENLQTLSTSLLSWYDDNADPFAKAVPTPSFRTFEDAFSHAFAEARENRTVLVIDEYPYLAKSYPGVSSLLQSLIDGAKGASGMMLVLCGSSTSFMREQVLGEKSPLYGRRTAQVRLEPFDYSAAAELLGAVGPERALELYSLVGGVPLYLEQLDGARTVRWNIANRMLGLGRFLYAEPENFMLQEVSAPASYNAVVGAIAHGRPRPSEIADATGIAAPNVSEYLKTLCELGIVRRDTPVGKSNKKKVVYRVSDGLFRFHHTFVSRYAAAIEAGMAERVAERICVGDFSSYMGRAFEEACRQWTVREIAAGGIDMLPSAVGSWWGADPAAREQVDVDVVALSVDGELFAGECKWTSDPIDVGVLEALRHRVGLVVDRPARIELALFSKSGFTRGCEREAARAGDVRLVMPADMF
ncbi:MAG: ATP-binding protein [Eggerthellaceae bacterium]|nr:ATP-binding protein [Eggerthellaceae bacterium]